MPTTLTIVPSGIAPSASLPLTESRVLMVLCMTKNAIAAERVAVAFSFSAMPSATPIANNSGRLSKITVPTEARSEKIVYGTVPGPITPSKLYASSVASLVRDAPTPNSRPAMGKSAMGSIKARPTRCKISKNPLPNFRFLSKACMPVIMLLSL